MDRFEAALSGLIVRWARLVHTRARAALLTLTAITVVCGVHAGSQLGINSDNVQLVAEHLPARQNYLEFTRSFPNIENVMLVVVDGETPELAREATSTLRDALAERPDLFRDVYIPGSGPFFEKHGLLYRTLEDLDEFALQMASVQPILTALEREPTVANLASLIESGLATRDEAGEDDPILDDLAVLLDRVGDATVEAYTEFPLEISWEEILLRGSSVETTRQWTIVVDPILDFDSIFAAAAPKAEIRRIAAAAGLSPERGVTVRLTGNPVINYEEMAGLLWDIGLGGVITFCFVVVVLWRALHSIRLVVASVVTLLVGLVWTGSFAAATVGALNLISVAFAILFIGLGVDFAIHLGMAYVDGLRRALSDDTIADPHLAGLEGAFEHVGSSFVICTITTAVGFYVFIPTDNIGVAELGLIAGSGMIVNLFLTTTLFPALLAGPLRLHPERDLPRPMGFHRTWWSAITAWPRTVATIAALALAWGAVQAVRVQFDANVVRMRDQGTESVQAFNEMLEASGQRSPWPMDTIAADLDEATRLAREIESLEVVELAVSLADYVPEDQGEKLDLLEDVGMLLDAPLGSAPDAEPPTTAEQIEALRALRDTLAGPSLDRENDVLSRSMRALRDRLDEFLSRAEGDEDVDAALARLEVVLLGGLTDQLQRLRSATFVDEVTLEALPDQLRARMLTPDGRARVQIFPAEQMTEEVAFTRFAHDVSAVVPGATGLPMNMIAFAEATRSSFEEALVAAILLITIFLVLLWRRLVPVGLVLAPLLLSNVLTIGIMSAAGIAFNFVNVVVVPLLLGIGVDSGIHLVHRAETLARTPGGGDLLSSTTARAVFYSALTTTVSFGTLALSSHQGVSSLGVVLTFGMMLTVVSNLVVLPSLLALRGTHAHASGHAPA